MFDAISRVENMKILNGRFMAPTAQEITDTRDALCSMIAHPRSLARPAANWIPPYKNLPQRAHCVFVTRYRVGKDAQKAIAKYYPGPVAAYLVTLRFRTSGPRIGIGYATDWVTKVVGAHNMHCVHELHEGADPTFCWVVDGKFRPLPSPAWLFTQQQAA